jgi:xylulokinase
MEGITFKLRRTLEIVEEAGIPVQQIRVVGGAAASTAWNQIRADIYGKPVIDSATNEGSVLGAVILGGLAAGVWPRVQAAVSTLCKPGLAVQPNPAHRSRYEALYALFKELHDQLIPPFERMRYIMGHEGPLDDRDSRESL